MKIEDTVNKESKFETRVLAEACLNSIKQGEVIQLERRGYFYVDKVATEDQPYHLHFLPDGRSKNISVIETKINVKTLTRGDAEEDPNKKKKKEAKAEAKAEKKAKKDEKRNEKKEEGKNNEASKTEENK